nr:RNA-directed DNA polymerase, eukaryota, reverse transcriptase zinc-binding domain protein [Tanacetum cinerariifolium]
MCVIGSDFMQLSLKVVEKLKEEIRVKEYKFIKYPDTEDLKPLNGHKFSEALTEKASFHTSKFVSPKSLCIKRVRTIFPSLPFVRESTFGFKLGTRNKQNINSRHDAENSSPQSTPQVFPSFEEYTPPVTYPEEGEEIFGILMEMIEDDWRLEFKEVSFLRGGLSLPVKQDELENEESQEKKKKELDVEFVYKIGGLGVCSLHAKNLGLLSKWKWRFLTEKNVLWRKVIKCFYGDDGGFNSDQAIRGHQGTWGEIKKTISGIEDIDASFKSYFKLKVSSGSCTLFWKDIWLSDRVRLMDRFPRLYALDLNHDAFIKDRRRLVNAIGGVYLVGNEDDKWT